jgi:hypothetical protein
LEFFRNIWRRFGIIDVWCPDYINLNKSDNKIDFSGSIYLEIIPTGNNTFVGLVNNKTLVPLDCKSEKNNISKEDLTLDWLDEKAECIEAQCPNYLFTKEYCSYNEREEELKHCSKYKVGNYVIEVKQ